MDINVENYFITRFQERNETQSAPISPLCACDRDSSRGDLSTW